MDMDKFVSTAQDAITVRRVFAEPYDKDGTTVIAAARVSGGGGGGSGHEEKGTKDSEGEGGGFGIKAAPAGAFVVRGGEVRWVPAIDPHRIVAAVAAVLVAVVATRGWVRVREIKAGLG